VWAAGYDGSDVAVGGHVFGAVVPQPFAFALVEPLSSAASSSMSYNQLRDIFLPVTSAHQAERRQERLPADRVPPPAQQRAHPGAGRARGAGYLQLHFPNGTADTFDQVAFTNADNTEVYLHGAALHGDLLPAAPQRESTPSCSHSRSEQLMTTTPAGPSRDCARPERRPRTRTGAPASRSRSGTRVKFLLLLILVWFVLVWSAMAANPLIGSADAVRIEARSASWVFVLIAWRRCARSTS
jgi:hypothetical protein